MRTPVTIVTGAASGIGRATVATLLAQGGAVVGVDLADDPDGPDERRAWVAGDVADVEVNTAAVELAGDRFGGLDGLVLNAGMNRRGRIDELPIDDFDAVQRVVVRATVAGIQAAVPALIEGGGGAIVATASTSGLGGDTGMFAYNTAKAGVINLVRAAALDLGTHAIRVNAVAPGPTETAMTTRIQSAPTMYEELRHRIALGRWGRPEEIAAAISFLLSPAASFISGVVLPVDGGLSANSGQFYPATD